MALCRLEDVRDVAFPASWWTAWALAVAIGLATALALRRRHARPAAVGLAAIFLSFPVWQTVVGTLPDIVRTFCAGGNVPAAIPGPPGRAPGAWEFSTQYMGSLLGTLAFLFVGGLLLVHARNPSWLRVTAVAQLARGLRGLLPMARGEMASIRVGVAAFPILAAANLALLAATGEPVLTAARDPYYQNMDVFHAVMIALAAAVGEELLFRGVMQQGLLRALGTDNTRNPVAQALVFALVGILFAYSHAGYGNATLLLFAFLFSVLASVTAQRFGIWAAIALHGLIDFFAFLRDVRHPDASIVVAAILVGCAVLCIAALELRHLLLPRPT